MDSEVQLHRSTAEHQLRYGAHGFDSGQSLDAFERLPKIGGAARRIEVRIIDKTERDAGGENMVRIEPWGDRLQFPKAFDEQSRSGEKRKSQGDLRDDQRAMNAATPRRSSSGPPAVFERPLHVGTGRLPGGR